MVQHSGKMKKIIIFAILFLICSCKAVSSKDDTRKIYGLDYIEINCKLSGGKKRIVFKNYIFTFVQTFHKKPTEAFPPIYGDLRSFVEIQKKTSFYNKKQIQRLKDWIKKYKITSIKPIENPGKKNLSAVRYPNSLMIYINSKEYKLNNYTIIKNPQLQDAFKELIKLAKEFTTIE